jgi:acyl-CoA thioesterase
VRTNRSTQHWQIDMVQAGDVVLTATAVTALRRSAWSANDAHRPVVASAMDVPLATMPFAVTWPQRYEMRPVAGLMPSVWDGHGSTSLSQMWVRDAPPRPLDFCALTAMADVFFPRIFLRRATRVPAGTVSMTVYFHADSAQLAATGTGYLLGQAQAQIFRNGFFDETGQLWNEAGDLLATMHQIVYYKE